MKKECYIYTFKIFVFCVLFSVAICVLFLIFDSIGLNDNSATNAATDSSVKVVVDAGHGGRDGGASDESGVLEKDLNLALSAAMRDFLSLCGIDTVMTRTKDSLVCDENDPSLKGKLKMTDLKNRLLIAEDYPEALFVSIHMNKFPIEKYSGLQVYYSRNNEQSATLAKSIQDSVGQYLQPENTRRCKAAGSNIFLLDRISSPAVLIECGFLSNFDEATKLASEEYRAKLALIIADSIILNLESMGNN